MRQSLGTRDMARARKKAVSLESPDNLVFKDVGEAVMAFLEHCESEALKYSTVRKYRNTLNHLNAFCETRKIDSVGELTTDHLDAFRAGRGLKPITSGKELELLRYLIDHRGKIISREELLESVWQYQPGVSSRTIDVHVAWLRQKLADTPQHPKHIHTVRGVGYRFSP